MESMNTMPGNSNDAKMLRLSLSSYAYLKGHDPKAGREAIALAVEFWGVSGTVDWFAVADDRHQFSFALVFVVLESQAETNEYSVVVRGTNPMSLDSWFRENFAVGTKVPWPGSPGAGKISQATATALALHEGLRDGRKSLYNYLQRKIGEDASAGKTSVLRFTGHSLGGLVAPLLALRFSESFSRFENLQIHVCSFAAPTAGDAGFASYLERSFLENVRQNFGEIRFIRCRDDVAVKVWNKRDMLGILRLYAFYGVPINLFLIMVLGAARWSVRKLGYTQPFADPPISGMFRTDATDLFALESFEAEDYLDGGLAAQFRRAKAIAKRPYSRRVFRNTFAWVVHGVMMHVVPYALHLLTEAEQKYVSGTLLKTILTHDTFFVERRSVPRGT